MHLNANFSVPSGGHPGAQYTDYVNGDWYTGAQPSRDVVYTFEISGNMKRVTISADYAETDFDT